MRKIFLLALVLAVVLGIVSYAFAVEPSTTTAIVSATVKGDFEVKFYPRSGIDNADTKIVFPTGAITFPAITGTETMVYPQGRSENDGKSDIGVLCLSNLANNVTTNRWGLKMKMTGNIPSDNIIVYIPEFAYDRNITGSNTLGGIQRSKGWYKVETSDILIYKADDSHLLTTQWGTLMTFSFAIIPSGKFMDGTRQVCNGPALPAGSYSASIIFTMTTGV
jgi:hypothetical protein